MIGEPRLGIALASTCKDWRIHWQGFGDRPLPLSIQTGLRFGSAGGNQRWQRLPIASVDGKEASKLLNGSSKLISAWLDSGRTGEDLKARVAKTPPLDGYELDLLERYGLNVHAGFNAARREQCRES